MRNPKDILGLDPKNFKHVKSDEHSTTLQHKDGHMLTIAHNVLSPQNRLALSALSKISQQAATPEQADEEKHQKKAEGGKISHQNKELLEKGMKSYKEKMPSPKRQQQIHERMSEMDKELKNVGHGPLHKEYPKIAQGGQISGMPTMYDEGGRVPAPAIDTSEQDKATRARQMSQGVNQSGGGKPNSDSPLTTGDWSHVWKAQGGEIEQMESQHGGEGHTCHACGGPIRHMYAEDGLVTKNPDIADVQGIIPQQPENSPFSASMAAKRHEYNDIVQGHNVGFAASEDPRVYEDVVQKSQFGPNGEPPANFDPKSWNQMEDERIQAKDNNATQVADEALKTAQYNQAAQAAGVPLKPTQDIPGNQNTNQAQPQQSQPPQNQQSQPPQGQPPQQQSNDPFSLTNYNAGVDEMANIQKEQLGQQIRQRQAVIDTYKNRYNTLDDERSKHISDIQNGYIDPNKYWQDHSKVAAGIGMILGGFNPTNRPNAAIEFLQHQMDKSIESQKANLDSKNNLLRANLQHFGDLHQATLATQAMMNDSLAQQMQQAALNAKNPLAKQAALGAHTALMQQSMQFQMQLSMRQTMMQLASGKSGNPDAISHALALGNAMPGGAEMMKPYMEAYVPGVGMSKSLKPVPKDAHDRIESYQNVMRMFNEASNFKKQNPGSMWSIGDRARAETLMTNLGNEIRTAESMGVIKPSEINMMKGMLGGNPAAFTSGFQTDPKIREMIHLKQNDYNNLLDNYDLPHPQSQDQFRFYEGKKYKRGPNGEAIEVK